MDIFYEKFGKALKEVGIVPVIAVSNEAELETLMSAVLQTPVKAIEITMRNEFAAKAIAEVKEKYPGTTVGAGTVVTEARLAEAKACGADFCVSPGLDTEIIKKAQAMTMPFLPGVCTPSEVLAANNLGLTTLKFFPAEAMGGADALKLYAGALADTVFIPTGGITMDNLGKYLSQKNVVACGGSFMAPKSAVSGGEVDAIVKNIIKCINICKESRGN